MSLLKDGVWKYQETSDEQNLGKLKKNSMKEKNLKLKYLIDFLTHFTLITMCCLDIYN